MLSFRFNIRLKLIFSFFLLVLVITAVFTIFSYFRARYAMQNEIQKHGIDVAKTFTQMATTHIFETDYITILDNATELVESSDIQSITVMDTNGKIWVSTNTSQINSISIDPFYEDILKNKELKYRKIRKDTKWILEFVSPVIALGKVAYLLKMEISLKNMENQLAERTQSILILSFGMIIIAILLGVVLSKFLTDPIKNLVKGTNEIAKGNLSYRINIHSQDEIGELSQSFNLMADNLQVELSERKNAEEELRKHRDYLEELVQKRTIKLAKANKKLEQEIDERKRTEEVLRESEEKFRSVVERAYDGITILQNDKFQYANPRLAEIVGYSVEEILSSPFARIFDPGELSKLLDRFQQHIAGEDVPSVYETILTHKDGSMVYVELNAGIIPYQGKPADFVFARNITERKRAEEEKKKLEAQLQQASKMEAIATLAGGIAHQFNNALSTITGNLGLLEMDLSDIEDMTKYVGPMKDSAHRMAQLTSQLLAYARGGKYQAKTISLSDFVRDTLQLIEHTLKPSIYIETDLPHDILSVNADLTQMQMVISAILFNASEAIEGRGRIRITCRNEMITDEIAKDLPGLKPGPYVSLTIADDGKGMDEETRSRIFEPFYTTKFQGRGLGMAASYGIVRHHDGWISIDSELGKGTTVRIYLPAIEAQVKEAVKPKTDLPKGAGTVLIIEDEEMVMRVNRALLERLGYHVLGAKTGREAINIAKTFDGDIDLAILDIVLPDMGGKAIYPLIMEARPNLKVIACSGYPFDGSAREILNAGAQDFIEKPFLLTTLSEKLKKVLEGK